MFRNFHHLNRKERYLSIYIYKSIYKSLRDCEALTRKRMEAGKEAKAAYQKRLSEYHHEQKEKRAAELQKKKAPWQQRHHTHTHTHPFIVFSTYCSSGIGWWSCDENWGHLIITLGTQQSHAAQELTHRLEAIATRVEAIALSLYSKLIESHMESAVSSCLTQASLS